MLPAVPTLRSDNRLRTSLLSVRRENHAEVTIVTIEEAAKFLFVSRAHIRHLLERGELVGVKREYSGGHVDVDTTSIQAYREKRRAAQRAYMDSQTEDNDPPGL
ncbi:helix-turn-helix domain-containing protein [Paraburkholderia ginsengiterrae]|uniref:helix-turn-helix domain-containing protein n=1 Tax=Paraburkholderia ginsengiterrae TaxID=1462993 RepID=UPI000AA6C783|nr:helix-turn-helix domain-containing protein [Paraburkholderia ginsengiterrae]